MPQDGSEYASLCHVRLQTGPLHDLQGWLQNLSLRRNDSHTAPRTIRPSNRDMARRCEIVSDRQISPTAWQWLLVNVAEADAAVAHRLVGVADVPKTGDRLFDAFLRLPGDTLAVMSSHFEI